MTDAITQPQTQQHIAAAAAYQRLIARSQNYHLDLDAYTNFLRSKIVVAKYSGFEADLAMIHPDSKEHQTVAIRWALQLGRALISMSFGLGKTRMQIEIAKQIVARTGQKFLVVCPLGVKHQFQDVDGPALDTRWEYVKTDAEIAASDTPYLLTNYERVRDGGITAAGIAYLAGASLDEGSVLRSLDSDTSDVFKKVFQDTPYRFVCTATPSPNDWKELIYYAEYLGVMDHGQALTRFFKRTTSGDGSAGHLVLMESQAENFWHWVASWALFVEKPSDLGFSDEGYSLPELTVHWHRIAVDHSRAWEQVDNRGQHRLFLNAATGVQAASAEKRATLDDRIEAMVGIMQQGTPEDHWILWHHLESEREAIERAVPDAVSVYGSQDLEVREDRILRFSRGQFRILSTKPEIAGSGCNFQRHCHKAIYLGVRYQFEEFIQSVHRLQRFMQERPVEIHIIYAESEDEIVNVLKRKWKQHNELLEKMRGIVTRYGLVASAIQAGLSRRIGVHRQEYRGEMFTAVNNDTVLEMDTLPSNSAGLILTSIPFGNHYEYTVNFEDFGHNPSDAAFWDQMDFLIPNLFRILQPGRLAAIHVKDRILYGHQTPSGFMEISEFSDDCVKAFRKHGFLFEGRRTVVTDVVRENNGTYRLSYTEMCTDASKMGAGLPEYVLLFRKPATSSENARADVWVSKSKNDYSLGRWQIDAHALWRSSGNRLATPEEYAQMFDQQGVASAFKTEQLNTIYDYERHVAIADAMDARAHLPKKFMLIPPKVTRTESDWVWDDIVFMRTLNTRQGQRRSENHICPLPLDIVARLIRLYSNPGDLVVDPFGGIATVAHEAIEQDRRALVCELNPEYWEGGVFYCCQKEAKKVAPTLFDMLAYAEAQ